MLRHILDHTPELEGFGIRVGVRLGGCSGMNLAIEFTERPEEGDITAEIHGITTHVSPVAAPYLEGVVLDFDPSPDGVGFTFHRAEPPDGDAEAEGGDGTAFEV